MAKAKTTQKLSKREIDVNIKRLQEVEAQLDALSKEQKGIKVLLESQYELPADQKEYIYGNEFFMEKVPVDKGKSSFNIEMLKTFLKNIRGGMKAIKKVEILDQTELNNLVSAGKLPPEVLDTCREHKFTFRSMFKKLVGNTVAEPTAAKEKEAI